MRLRGGKFLGHGRACQLTRQVVFQEFQLSPKVLSSRNQRINNQQMRDGFKWVDEIDKSWTCQMEEQFTSPFETRNYACGFEAHHQASLVERAGYDPEIQR